MVSSAERTRRNWMLLLSIIVLIGLGFYVHQLIRGLEVTGMNNLVSWGLYIITFAFLVGLSAGGLIVSSTAYVLKIDKLKQVAPVGIVVAVACIIGAGVLIVADVGHPERIFNIILGGRYTSPLAWDFLVISIYLAVGLYECWILFSQKWQLESEEKREKILAKAAYFSLPIALLVHSITAWIFGLQIGRPFWATALMAPIFISSAIVSGLGILLVIAYLGRKAGIPGLDEDNVDTLVKMLAGFILLDLFLFFCELFTLAYGGGTAAADAAYLILTGKFAPLLWIELIVGMVLPFIILVNKSTRRSPGWIAASGILVMVAVFLKRINIILPGFLIMNMPDAPGVSTGRFIESTGQYFEAGELPFATMGVYAPTLHEIAITIGALALVALIITYGVGLVMKKDSPSQTSAAGISSQQLSGGVAE